MVLKGRCGGGGGCSIAAAPDSKESAALFWREELEALPACGSRAPAPVEGSVYRRLPNAACRCTGNAARHLLCSPRNAQQEEENGGRNSEERAAARGRKERELAGALQGGEGGRDREEGEGRRPDRPGK